MTAHLNEEHSRRTQHAQPVGCEECFEELEEIQMDGVRAQDLPPHDHPTAPHVTDQLKRHEMYIDQLQGENARMFGNIETALEYLKVSMHDMSRGLTEMSKRIDQQDIKLDRYNNVKERVDQIEATYERLGKDFIMRDEFNNAMKAIRDQQSTVVWVIGLGLTAIGTAVGFLLFGG